MAMNLAGKIQEAAAQQLAAMMLESGASAEECAADWTAAAARDGNYPQVRVPLSPDTDGRYSCDPSAPAILRRASFARISTLNLRASASKNFGRLLV